MPNQPTQMSLARIGYRTLLVLIGIAAPVTGHADESTLSASATCKQARKYVKKNKTHGLTASQLNTYGMRCYSEGLFQKAIELFETARSVDGTHILARYNLACATARSAERDGYYSDYDTWNLLQEVIELDTARLERIWSDSDFSGFRKRMEFPASPMEAPAVAGYFHDLELWGPTPASYTTAYAKFNRTHATALTGTVSGWFHGAEASQEPTQGTWRAERGHIIIDWESDTAASELIIPERINRWDPAYHDGWFTYVEDNDEGIEEELAQ